MNVKRAANRANAKMSTGPKSRAGKSRASQNAHRHGLAAQARLDSTNLDRGYKLAHEIMESMDGKIDMMLARSIAFAELDVIRARSVFTALLTQLCRTEDGAVSESGLELQSLANVLRELKMVQRYVRRSLSRRDNLIQPGP